MPILSAIPCSSSFDILYPGTSHSNGLLYFNDFLLQNVFLSVSEIQTFQEDLIDLLIRWAWRTLLRSISPRNQSRNERRANVIIQLLRLCKWLFLCYGKLTDLDFRNCGSWRFQASVWDLSSEGFTKIF